MDLVELAQAALLIGKEHDGIEILTRAHQAFLNRDQAQPAARCAFWLGFQALLNGDQAHANWLAFARGAPSRRAT